jgi:hypothetical protein
MKRAEITWDAPWGYFITSIVITKKTEQNSSLWRNEIWKKHRQAAFKHLDLTRDITGSFSTALSKAGGSYVTAILAVSHEGFIKPSAFAP